MLVCCFPTWLQMWMQYLVQLRGFTFPPCGWQLPRGLRRRGKHPPCTPFPILSLSGIHPSPRSVGILHVKNLTGSLWWGESVAPSLEPSSPSSRFPPGPLGCKFSCICKGSQTLEKANAARNTLNWIFCLKFLLCKLCLLNLPCIYRVISGYVNYNRLWLKA